MPQLIPFYWLNQLSYGFVLLGIITYIFSKYILPLYLQIYLTRIFLSKL